MKRPKSLVLLIYFIFHIALLAVAIYTNYRSEDFEFLLWLRGKMAWMVYISIGGLVLYFVTLLVMGVENRAHKKEKGKLEQEINALKAKMFDLQEATGTATKTEDTIPAATNTAEDDSATNTDGHTD